MRSPTLVCLPVGSATIRWPSSSRWTGTSPNHRLLEAFVPDARGGLGHADRRAAGRSIALTEQGHASVFASEAIASLRTKRPRPKRRSEACRGGYVALPDPTDPFEGLGGDDASARASVSRRYGRDEGAVDQSYCSELSAERRDGGPPVVLRRGCRWRRPAGRVLIIEDEALVAFGQ